MRQIYYFFTALLFIFANHAYSENTLSYAQQSEINGVIAKQYFASYMDKNWKQLELLLAEDGSFSDPTAEPVFGKVENIGKQAVMKNFREGYASINYMRFNQSRVLLSGQYAIFEGTLDWSLSLLSDKFFAALQICRRVRRYAFNQFIIRSLINGINCWY